MQGATDEPLGGFAARGCRDACLNWGRGGKAERLEKRACRKEMEKKSKPTRFKTEACGTHTFPATRNLPPACLIRDTRAFYLVFPWRESCPCWYGAMI